MGNFNHLFSLNTDKANHEENPTENENSIGATVNENSTKPSNVCFTFFKVVNMIALPKSWY